MKEDDKSALEQFQLNVDKVRRAVKLLDEVKEYIAKTGCVIGEMEESLTIARESADVFVRVSDKAIKKIENEYSDPNKFMGSVVDSIEDILRNGSDNDVERLLNLL